MAGVISTGSIAFIGTTRFQGHWNPVHNAGTASSGTGGADDDGIYGDLHATGSPGGANCLGGYANVTNLTASQGDYWQIIEDKTSLTLAKGDGSTSWETNDWLVFSGSSWMRLGYRDVLASVVLGKLDQSIFHMGDPQLDQDVVFAIKDGATSELTGSKKFQYNYNDAKLILDGDFAMSGSATLGNADTDVTTVTGQLTASEGLFVTDGPIRLGNDDTDVTTIVGPLTASEGIAAVKKSYFSSSVVLGAADSNITYVNSQLTAAEGLMVRNGPIQIGNGDTKKTLVHSQFTASYGLHVLGGGVTVAASASFNDNVKMGVTSADVVSITSQLTASQGIKANAGSDFGANVYLGGDLADFVSVRSPFSSSYGIAIGSQAGSIAGVKSYFTGSVKLGESDTRVIETKGQLTASEGISAKKKSYFSGSVVLGETDTNIVHSNAQITASKGLTVTGGGFRVNVGSASFLDNVQMGATGADVVSITSQTTASNGIFVNGPAHLRDNVTLGETSAGAGSGRIRINNQTTSSAGIFYGEYAKTTLNHVTAALGIKFYHPTFGNARGVTPLEGPVIKTNGVDGSVNQRELIISGSEIIISSSHLHILEDNRISLGNTKDSYIKHSDSRLVLSSSDGVWVSSSQVTLDSDTNLEFGEDTQRIYRSAAGNLALSASEHVRIVGHSAVIDDDKKLYFGTTPKAHIKYRSDEDILEISGSVKGTVISGNVNIPISGKLAFDADTKEAAAFSSYIQGGHGSNGGSYMMLTSSHGVDIRSKFRIYYDQPIEFGSYGWPFEDLASSATHNRAHIRLANTQDGTDTVKSDWLELSGSRGGGIALSGSVINIPTAWAGGSQQAAGSYFPSILTFGGATSYDRGTGSPFGLLKHNFIYGSADGATIYMSASTGLAFYGHAMQFTDDTKLIFGNSADSYIKFDHSSDEYLLISGSSSGIALSGSVINMNGVVKLETAASGTKAGPGSFMAVDTAGKIVLSSTPASSGDVSTSGNNTFTGTNTFSSNLTASAGLIVKDNKRLFFGDSEESWIRFDEAGEDFMVISGSDAGVAMSGSLLKLDGNVQPVTDNTYNLGSATKRWANVYTGDLHLKNDRGDWTIVEEADYLCVINNRTGKKYEMMLKEIE